MSFYGYLTSVERMNTLTNWWHGLVHVCRRWRQLIYASPRRLNRLLCTGRMSIRKNFGLWPAIPISICESVSFHDPIEQENLFAAFEHRDRVRGVSHRLTRSHLEKVAMTMQELFPAQTHRHLALTGPPDRSVPIKVPIVCPSRCP